MIERLISLFYSGNEYSAENFGNDYSAEDVCNEYNVQNNTLDSYHEETE